MLRSAGSVAARRSCGALGTPHRVLQTVQRFRASPLGHGRRTACTLGLSSKPLQAATHANVGGTTAVVDDYSSPLVPRLPTSKGPVLVYFKHDLRISDHPGLLSAIKSGAKHIIPFFCLDPELYSPLCLTPGGPGALLASLHKLKSQLKALGSDLVVRVGPTAATAAGFVGQAGVERIVMEREEETRWLQACHNLSEQLQQQGIPSRMTTWQAPLWHQTSFKPNFKEWKAARGKALDPLPAPQGLPPLPAGIEPGSLPSLGSLQQLLAAALTGGNSGSSTAAAAADLWAGDRASARSGVLNSMLTEADDLPQAAAVSQLVSLLLPAAESDSQNNSGVTGYEGVIDAEKILDAYLVSDYMTPSSQQLQFLRDAVQQLETPAAPGASFPALLGPLVTLGALSSRQIYSHTYKAETARWGGRMPMFGASSVTAKAALAAVELSDFHRQLAGHIPQEGDVVAPSFASSSSSSSGTGWWDEPVASASSSYDEGPDGVQQWGVTDWPAGVPRRCSWRWRGALTDYCVVEPKTPKPNAPALVLVHGFGAFGDQWRFNLGPLAAAGYRVYAPTLPGFGRSEKAALQYSQNAWRDFIRDFLVCVVGHPAVVAGNSIGGFIVASAAADYPSLVAGLVLVNSAGPITPGVTAADVAAAAAEVKKAPPAFVVKLSTMALMAYLQNSIGKQLKWLYPTNPDNADEWLEQEIYRAASDSRASDVFASVFYLPKPRPLNYLINELWKGPTAVVQGVLDPLNDAKSRANQLKSLCSGLRVWEIQAGHCPHDELPDDVNAALLQFVEEEVLQQQQQQQEKQQEHETVAAAGSQ